MLGGWNDWHPVLLTPEEGAAIITGQVTMESVNRARAFVREWQRLNPDLLSGAAQAWTLGAIYEAGRIQGKREERQKHHN